MDYLTGDFLTGDSDFVDFWCDLFKGDGNGECFECCGETDGFCLGVFGVVTLILLSVRKIVVITNFK